MPPAFDVRDRVRVVRECSQRGEHGTVVARHLIMDKYRYHVAMDYGKDRAPVHVWSEKDLEAV